MSYPIQERTVGNILADRAENNADDPYLLFEDDAYTFADAELKVNSLAHGFLARGVTKGVHVALLMDNCPEYLWVVYALGRIGAIAVPINTAANGRLLRYYIEDSDCDWIVIDKHYVVEVIRAFEDGTVPTLVIRDGEAAEGGTSIGDLYAEGESRSESRPDVEVSHHEPWMIMYTSGTTGPSKGVVCPHAHPMTVAGCVSEMFDITADDRMYTFLPMFHGNALWYSAFVALSCGGSIGLAERFSASRFWGDVHRFQATEFNAIMSVATILEKLPVVPEEQDNPLRLAFIVPLPLEREQLEERWGLEIVCNYAMTEIIPAAVLGPGDGHDRRGTSGRLSAFIETKIVDERDHELPPGEVGEVVVRPKQPWTTFTEYYNKPEATAEAMQNLWFHTGDTARVDEDGYFYFVDRRSDSIRRRGENISAHEIEMLLELDPRVAEAAAVPVPSELGEEDVAVHIVRADPELTELDVIEYSKREMAYFLVPRYIAFCDQIPKTANGKKAKFKIRQAEPGKFGELWDREDHGIVVKRRGKEA